MQLSATSPKLVVTSANTFWKASEAVESGAALGEFGQLKAEFGDRVEVGATTFSETTGQKIRRTTSGWVKKLPYILLGAGALGVSVASAGLLTPLAAAGVAGATAGGLSVAWLGGGLNDAIKNTKNAQGLAAHHTGFDTLNFENLPEESGPEAGLREMTIKNMSLYPEARHVLHLNGHGHGAKSFAGLSGKEAQRSLVEAVQKSGQKYDVVFYESCYGANWENLHQQAEVANYAVAFEDAIPKSNTSIGRLDLSDILQAGIGEKSDREVAVEMARTAGHHFDGKEAPIAETPFPKRLSPINKKAISANTDSTAVAVDLTSLRQDLSPSLDRLGTMLTKELKENDELKEAARDAQQRNLLESSGDLVDMGGFLRDLREAVPGAEKQEAFDQALRAMDLTLLHKRTGEKMPLSGLSFHSKPDKMNFSNPASPAHQDPTLPKAWLRFIDQAL